MRRGRIIEVPGLCNDRFLTFAFVFVSFGEDFQHIYNVSLR